MLHGGRALAGALAPGFIDGRTSRWSPHAPARYAVLAAQVAAGDPLDLSDDIHMLSARIAEVFAAMDGSQPSEELARLIDSLAKLRDLPDEAQSLVGEMRVALEQGKTIEKSWEEARQLFRERTKMVESQRKRDLEGGKYVTAEEMISMVRQMALAMKNRVNEHLSPDVGARLLADVSSDLAAIQGVDKG